MAYEIGSKTPSSFAQRDAMAMLWLFKYKLLADRDLLIKISSGCNLTEV